MASTIYGYRKKPAATAFIDAGVSRKKGLEPARSANAKYVSYKRLDVMAHPPLPVHSCQQRVAGEYRVDDVRIA